jgi:hypothetical protein
MPNSHSAPQVYHRKKTVTGLAQGSMQGSMLGVLQKKKT